MKTTHGFTLIEMLTVIVIIGLIIGIGIPVMNNLTRSTGLKGATRQLSNTLHLARQYAITHRVRTDVKVGSAWNSIAVYTNGAPLDKSIFFPNGVVCYGTNTPPAVTFKPTGDAAAQTAFVIREGIYDTNGVGTWIGMNSNITTVTVYPVLGRIKITP